MLLDVPKDVVLISFGIEFVLLRIFLVSDFGVLPCILDLRIRQCGFVFLSEQLDHERAWLDEHEFVVVFSDDWSPLLAR